MLLLAAISFLAGTIIGLRLDIRVTIGATIVVLLGWVLSGAFGWTSLETSIFRAFANVAALQAGYVAIAVLNAMGMIAATETTASPIVEPPVMANEPDAVAPAITPASASDNPSHP